MIISSNTRYISLNLKIISNVIEDIKIINKKSLHVYIILTLTILLKIISKLLTSFFCIEIYFLQSNVITNSITTNLTTNKIVLTSDYYLISD